MSRSDSECPHSRRFASAPGHASDQPGGARPVEDWIMRADAEQLLEILRARGENLDQATARLALRSPHLTREGIVLILGVLKQHLDYETRLALARHRLTPEPRAVALLATLYWRDLAKMARDVRSKPVIRRAAEKQVVERLPGLALGERITLARIASGLVLAALLGDNQVEVVRVLLENPRTTEPTVVRLASSQAASGAVLELLCRSPRWARRREVRVALARNRKTPSDRVLSLLPGLPKGDLRALARNVLLAPAVRRRAALLAGMEDPLPGSVGRRGSVS